MGLDRDLTVAIVRAALPEGAGAVGLEPFAATGIRGLRLLVETGRFRRFVLADRGAAAMSVLAANAGRYIDPGARAVRANAFRPPFRAAFDYVDLDPFGTPMPYVDAGLGALRDGGLLALTATDMPVLAGVSRGTAQLRYGGRPVRGRLGPEGGLRLLLAAVAARARVAGRAIRPVAAYVHDHHVRALLRVASADGAPADPVGTLEPEGFPGPPLPRGGPYGPMWLGGLFDPAVLDRTEVPAPAANPRSAARWIATFRGEAALVAPFYYESNELASSLGLASPPRPDRVVERLIAAGFPAARTHVRDGAIRTPAPRAAVEAAALDRPGPSA